MSRAVVFLILIGLTAACQPTAPKSNEVNAATVLQELLDDHWAAQEREKIFFRTDPDAWRMDGRMSEHTDTARQRREQTNQDVLDRLAQIDSSELSDKDRLTYRIFEYERLTERDSYRYPEHVFPITALFGYHSYYADAPAAMSFLSAADYDKYLVSLEDFPRYNGEHIANMREGIDTGFVHHCESIDDYGKTMSMHVVDDPLQSAFYGPFENFPATVSDAQRQEYTAKGLKLIEDVVVPQYERLTKFFDEEYLPNCRKDVGINSVPGGEDYYQYLIRYFTTTNMSPQEIHDLGLSEVARIRAEMDAIIASVEFEGSYEDFLTFLRTDPRFYADSVRELLGEAALISKTAEGVAPKFFSLLPRGTYKIASNPNRGTFYMPSSGDGTTSGTYFVSTKDLKSQGLYTLEALTLHEGVPGHHLQSALAMELGLPKFRRTMYHSAYGEGWGLYSERLGKEMGFYTDPYSDFGRLTYEMWRACRLVVDTGMHAFGWSRQQAIDYLLENAGVSVLEATDEIDRYITWPAQALSYKIGELKIRELRQRAENALGANFDIRSFHDTVVGNGSLPIEVLEEMIDEWIASEEAKL